MNILGNYQLILGSGSPRRKKILEEADIPFTVRVIEVDESYPQELPCSEVAAHLALKKAKAHPIGHEKEILLTADSVVINDGKILEKPLDYADAYKMLSSISGSIHEVTTAFCLRHMDQYHVKSITSKVWFNKISEKEKDYYINNYKPYDKAGGYGIQEWIGHVKISKIEGSYLNIVGLPMEAVYESLNSLINYLASNI
jgi:septum formation protein